MFDFESPEEVRHSMNTGGEGLLRGFALRNSYELWPLGDEYKEISSCPPKPETPIVKSFVDMKRTI